MEKITRFTLKHKKIVIILFVLLTLLSALAASKVQVNFNIIDYLPESSPSTKAISEMDSAFSKGVPNLRVMVSDVDIPTALEYKARLSELDGVEDINWLDNAVDINQPIEMMSQETVKSWYVDGNAVFSLKINTATQEQTLDEIRNIIGENNAISGSPMDMVSSQKSINQEIRKIMLIIFPLVIAILLFATMSWIEPLFIIINLAIAIAINMGTNIFFGEISFVTRTTALVLQLACSIDYSIFLIDHFKVTRKQIDSPFEALVLTVKESTVSIMSSGLTTIIGFLALVAMQFKIGPDMGIVLAKGIVISLLTTLIFLPCILIGGYKLIDKTSHRSFMPSFKKFGKGIMKIKNIVAIVILIIVVPTFLASEQTAFLFGMSKMAAPDSQTSIETKKINDTFGQSAAFVFLVPTPQSGGSSAVEEQLIAKTKELPQVTNVISYASNVGSTIPSEFVPEDKIELLYSNGYSRIVVSAAIPPESEESFRFVEQLRKVGDEFFPEQYHLVGEIANIYDIKDTITSDSMIVNILSIGGIALVIMLTFKSLSLPFILIFVIQSSIFINMAFPYFSGTELNYIGYLVISSVQLGATVDYALLFSSVYLKNRESLYKKEALYKTITDTAGSILTSGGILVTAGLVLGLVSTNGIISQLGILLARGAGLSTVLVLTCLPALLNWMDGLIQKTTRGTHFLNPIKQDKKQDNHIQNKIEGEIKNEKKY